MKNKNVSAFPVCWVEIEKASNAIKRTVYHSDGMSLRDWFAGQAMIALSADMKPQTSYADLAESAYEYADLMMYVRDK